MTKRKMCRYSCGRQAENETATRCRTCRRNDKKAGRPVRHEILPGGPRVLLVDIETSPNLVYTWGLFNQNIGINQIVEPTRMLCFAAKWLGEPDVMFFSEQTGHSYMVAAAHDLLDQADVLVHWNGTSFDSKHLNREILQYGITPPSPVRQVDLLLATRKQFRFPSNKLAYVSEALGLTGKEETGGFDLWRRCMDGDAEAWKTMQKYNERDVTLLEEILEVLLPWVPAVPNRHLYFEGGCPACGADELVPNGLYRTALSTFDRYTCRACGSWFRGSKRIGGVEIQAAVR